jgi:hypothetical protein
METKITAFSRICTEHRQHDATVVYCERGVVEGCYGVGVAEAQNDVVDGDDTDVCVRLNRIREYDRL